MVKVTEIEYDFATIRLMVWDRYTQSYKSGHRYAGDTTSSSVVLHKDSHATHGSVVESAKP